jgi:hypothetical protein
MGPLYLLGVWVVGVVGFVVSSTFGIGGALLLLPVLMMRLPAAQAVAVVSPVMLASNLTKAWVFRAHIDKRATWLVSALAVPVAAVAAAFASLVDDRLISLGVAVLIVLSLVAERGMGRAMKFSERSLLLWGAVTGAVSGLCGAAGPPTAIGLKGYGLTRESFVGTVAVYAVLLQLVKMPGYIYTGQFPSTLWPLASLLAMTSVMAAAVAPRLLRHVPVARFKSAVDVLLALTAFLLVADVAWRFWRA